MWFVSWYKTIVKNFIRNHDTILFYSKNKDRMDFNKVYIDNKDFKQILPPTKDIKNIFKDYNINEDLTEKICNKINYEMRWEKYPLEDTWNCNKWDDLNSIAIESSTSRVEETVNLNNENFKWQKPEKLLQRIIESSSNTWDIVLDFHLWSWTTCAVAHKMWRQYIWIEQMDYIDNTSIKRLKDVIKWEKEWISEKIWWKWWWDFIYMEIMQENQRIINDINNSKNISDLLEIYNTIKDSEFINYKIITSTINLNKLEEKDFEDFKLFLIEILDKNLLYKNYSERDDKNSGINEENKKINNLFYNN